MKKSYKLIKINQKIILGNPQLQTKPPNLACNIKKICLFDRWKKDEKKYKCTTLNGFKNTSFEGKNYVQLYSYIKIKKQQREGQEDNYLTLKYKNPKHFSTKIKDHYLGITFVHDIKFKLTKFVLYFNPVRKTLSILKNKYNDNKAKEAENNKKTSSDW